MTGNSWANSGPCNWLRNEDSATRVPLLIATAVAVTLGYAAPTGSALAAPLYPVSFMEYDGTYVVGKDIQPGLYMTWGATGTGVCSWSRLSSIDSRDAGSVIGRGESAGAQYALISSTDVAFETYGCQTWSRGSRPATPIAPVPKTCIYPLTGCVDPAAG